MNRAVAVDPNNIVLNHEQIQEILPHRYPFLLVDRVVHFDNENYLVGQKNLTMNEQFFQGHFPGTPIMPGVLILEALAQAGGVLTHLKGFISGFDLSEDGQKVYFGLLTQLSRQQEKIRKNNKK